MRLIGGSVARGVVFCGLLVGAGCSSPRTEVIVVVDSDLEVPRELNRITVSTTSPDERERASESSLSSADSLPATVGLSYRGGPLGPFEIEARGMLGPIEVVTRRATFYFERQKTLALLLHLPASCRSAACDDDETCGEDGCRSIEATEADLVPWDGSAPRLGDPRPDAGPDAAADGGVGGDTGADAGSDTSSGCAGDEVEWEGTCMAPAALADCDRDCDFAACNDLDEVVCLHFDGDYRCAGRMDGEPWGPCGRGW